MRALDVAGRAPMVGADLLAYRFFDEFLAYTARLQQQFVRSLPRVFREIEAVLPFDGRGDGRYRLRSPTPLCSSSRARSGHAGSAAITAAACSSQCARASSASRMRRGMSSTSTTGPVPASSDGVMRFSMASCSTAVQLSRLARTGALEGMHAAWHRVFRRHLRVYSRSASGASSRPARERNRAEAVHTAAARRASCVFIGVDPQTALSVRATTFARLRLPFDPP